jgi:hypothetical protein
MTTEEPTPDPKKHFTHIRAKPKIKKEEVQATDDTHASVAELSAWLAEDPTSQKKLRHVRRGRHVIFMSRMFEKGLIDTIVEEAKIERGAVADSEELLQECFPPSGSRERGTWVCSAQTHQYEQQSVCQE